MQFNHKPAIILLTKSQPKWPNHIYNDNQYLLGSRTIQGQKNDGKCWFVVVSDHHLENYSLHLFQTLCIHLLILDSLCKLVQSLFSCDQAALWMVQSVCLSVRPSVCLSVCHTFLTIFPSSYHHEIFRSYYQWQKWRPCKRSRSEVKGQGHRGHDST